MLTSQPREDRLKRSRRYGAKTCRAHRASGGGVGCGARGKQAGDFNPSYPVGSGRAWKGPRPSVQERILPPRSGRTDQRAPRYREGQPSADEGIVDTVSETVGTFTDV